MAANERMHSIKKTTGVEGDKQMNINRKTPISEGGKLAHTNR
jgi:hypothetical protein